MTNVLSGVVSQVLISLIRALARYISRFVFRHAAAQFIIMLSLLPLFSYTINLALVIIPGFIVDSKIKKSDQL